MSHKMSITPSIRPILEHKIAHWLQRRAAADLKGRALACAVNARNFLARAEMIAKDSTIVSYFCATHATEEAVAAFVSACKSAGYPEAKAINLRDHKEKATVSAFAQFISGHLHDAGLSVEHEPEEDVLVARVRSGDAVQYYPFGLHLFTFNEDRQSETHIDAFEGFSALFGSPEDMRRHIATRSTFRDKALYASRGGAPAMSEDILVLQLQDHAFLTLGLIWAAIDVVNHRQREPFVIQVLGAINEVNAGFKSKPPGPCTDAEEQSH
ncbi:hypothetical protein [Rhizobium brockwellii]|uniref:hypothetical protein n=1 Tax=Rhizobium brockwellii TaxID=3019932 RepID=UPI000522FF03|nr:hypothetical protein [Rhizobium brockwellii]KPN22700.1 hypothetical protein KS05_31965 [Rhizobium brockwellii]QJX09980.1 hypothetical protein RLCC275e_33955 [Rhizobium brockwellii]